MHLKLPRVVMFVLALAVIVAQVAAGGGLHRIHPQGPGRCRHYRAVAGIRLEPRISSRPPLPGASSASATPPAANLGLNGPPNTATWPWRFLAAAWTV